MGRLEDGSLAEPPFEAPQATNDAEMGARQRPCSRPGSSSKPGHGVGASNDLPERFDKLKFPNIIQCMLNHPTATIPESDSGNPAELDPERIVALLKALADPRRLSIWDMLMEGVQCNCEIAERLDVSLSLVSYHLRILSQAGLVSSEPDPDDARWLYYSINRATLEQLQQKLGRLLDVQRIQPRQPSCGPRGCKIC